VNAVIAIAGVLTFSWLSFSRLQTTSDLFSGTGLVAVIALIFLAALYYATSTVRRFSVPHVEQIREAKLLHSPRKEDFPYVLFSLYDKMVLI